MCANMCKAEPKPKYAMHLNPFSSPMHIQEDYTCILEVLQCLSGLRSAAGTLEGASKGQHLLLALDDRGTAKPKKQMGVSGQNICLQSQILNEGLKTTVDIKRVEGELGFYRSFTAAANHNKTCDIQKQHFRARPSLISSFQHKKGCMYCLQSFEI